MSSSSHLLPIYFVDAFTSDGNAAFTGNPAAVCFLDYDDDINDVTKQKIASEVNLSETAFVSYGWKNGEKLLTAEGSQLHRRTIRWFTRTNEVDLCGHATVASTKALVECQLTDLFVNPEVKSIPISFDSKCRGKLGAVWARKDSTRMTEDRITLNFPSDPTHSLSTTSWLDEMIVTTLGGNVSPDSICDVQYAPKNSILMLRLTEKNIPDDSSPANELRKVSPNFQKLLTIDTGDIVHDIIVTIKGEGDVNVTAETGNKVDESGALAPHFYSRFFGPWDGIDEDPVTGLGHTVLTPYWTRELRKSSKGDENFDVGTLLGRQHSTRGGSVFCTLVGDRVQLSGTAKIMIKGQMFI